MGKAPNGKKDRAADETRALTAPEPILDDPALEGLSHIERLWVLAYVTPGPSYLHATRALEASGWTPGPEAPRYMRHQTAYHYKSKPKVRAAVNALLMRRVMPVQEALAILSDIMAGPARHLISIEEEIGEDGTVKLRGRLDVEAAVANGYGHCISEITQHADGSVTVKTPSILEAHKVYQSILTSLANGFRPNAGDTPTVSRFYAEVIGQIGVSEG